MGSDFDFGYGNANQADKSIDLFVESAQALLNDADKALGSRISDAKGLDDVFNVLGSVKAGFESFFSSYSQAHNNMSYNDIIDSHDGLRKLMKKYAQFYGKYSKVLDENNYVPFSGGLEGVVNNKESFASGSKALGSMLSYSSAFAEYSYNRLKPVIVAGVKKTTEGAKTVLAYGLYGGYMAAKLAANAALGIGAICANVVKYAAQGAAFAVGFVFSSPSVLLSSVLIGSAVFSSYFVATHYLKESPVKHAAYSSRNCSSSGDGLIHNHLKAYSSEAKSEAPGPRQSSGKNLLPNKGQTTTRNNGNDANSSIKTKDGWHFNVKCDEKYTRGIDKPNKPKNKDLWRDPIEDPDFDPVEHWDIYVR